MRKEVKDLRKELVTRESKAMKEVLMGAEVILATANSAASDGPLKHLPQKYFNLLIIDEAAQALEISCWIPVLQSPRLVRFYSNNRCVFVGVVLMRAKI